jgi:hypothetical protein
MRRREPLPDTVLDGQVYNVLIVPVPHWPTVADWMQVHAGHERALGEACAARTATRPDAPVPLLIRPDDLPCLLRQLAAQGLRVDNVGGSTWRVQPEPA